MTKKVYLIGYSYYSSGVLQEELVCRAYSKRGEATLDARDLRHKHGWENTRIVTVHAAKEARP